MVVRAMAAGCVLLVGVPAWGAPAPAHAAGPREPTWFEHVEHDRDRGAGRVEDQQTWELRRMREDRARRSFEQVNAERDRQLQIEALQRQAGRTPVGKGPEGGSVILSHAPEAAGIMMSPM